MRAGFSMDDLKIKLQNSQYKMTHQRRIVLEVFTNHPGEHLSAEDVHGILRTSDADIGLATVYRTLELLSGPEIGVLQKMEFGDGCSRYEINLKDPNAHQHHHLICTKCNKVFEVSDDMLDELESNIAAKCKFKVLDHQVKFFGLCQECQ